MKGRPAWLASLASLDREARAATLTARGMTLLHSELGNDVPVFRWLLGGVPEFWHLPNRRFTLDERDISIPGGQLLVTEDGSPIDELAARRFLRVRNLMLTF